ncbi:PREDICTED: WD repeat-containing protein on Y chromosome-like isoform X2 [Thamnophis sirtalis]|uniref:WD repeat-containing protein on Y chromosome-like isoform X2 n=1 Tax=Thamnophis sirtalis TaxID=35019 RepID=A0A6I9XXW1_9SAUR|nr:PREDICTED: WD repeat-containing protein on Y chromosome-like isoform X2 [Thamnophis sirtalis]
MPLRKKVRPSSASGKLETSTLTSILNELTEPTLTKNSLFGRAQTSFAGPRLQTASPVSIGSFSEDRKNIPRPPEWLVRELLKRQQRSHSIGLMENISESESIHHRADSSRSQWKGKIEQHLTLDQLQKLYTAFQGLETSGHKSVDIESFKHILKTCVGSHNATDEEVEKLFMKIDYLATGNIQWHDFCTYLQIEYAELDSSSTRLKEVTFSLPAAMQEIPHGEPVLRICSLVDSTLITAQEDGQVSFWSPEFKLKRSKMVFEKIQRKSKWLMDFTVMTPYNKLILGTGDRELQFYESSNFEPYLQISGLEAVPLNLDYCYTDHDECMILYGDDQGCVNILQLYSVGETLRTWKRLPKVENLPNIRLESAILSSNVTYIRWKVHGDWVTQLNYYDSIKAIISASSHEPTALVIGCIVGATNVEQQMREIKENKKDSKMKKAQEMLGTPSQRAEGDQIIFRVHKGVKTFALSKKNNAIVTGGMDRIIRIWNPYMAGRPTGMLKSHMAPIFYVYVSEEDKIFSISTDNTVKIWDMEDQTCLFTACSKNSGIKGEITTCHYISGTRSLCVATDTLAILHLRLRSAPDLYTVTSHKKPVLCCKFNKVFRHVVSCSEDSVVKVWDFESGKPVFEFGNAHGDSAITCLTFDFSGRRLITGGKDGCLKIWNYNNGQCLHTLKKDDFYHIKKPQPHWQDDINWGHKEDILCVAQCPPNLLATSSYDGEIIVWNMISGHIDHRFYIPMTTAASVHSQIDVTRIIFLKTRAVKFDSTTASLVSNGPQGYLHFWSLFSEDPLIASFQPSRGKSLISSIATTANDSYMYAADEDGYVYVHDIQNYALQDTKEETPKYVNHWRAHLGPVLTLEVIDEDNILLSGSIDCTIRLWSLNGEYIGTFGQEEPWEIFNTSSWKHPMVPYEILIDPQSMPIHPMLEDTSSNMQIISQDENKNLSKATCNPHSSQITDEDIEEEINKRLYSQASSRRMKYERSKLSSRWIKHRGPSIYHAIDYYEIDNFSGNCEKPDLSVLGVDIFRANYQGATEQ